MQRRPLYAVLAKKREPPQSMPSREKIGHREVERQRQRRRGVPPLLLAVVGAGARGANTIRRGVTALDFFPQASRPWTKWPREPRPNEKKVGCRALSGIVLPGVPRTCARAPAHAVGTRARARPLCFLLVFFFLTNDYSVSALTYWYHFQSSRTAASQRDGAT